jgi:hypothetical protein
MALQEVPKAERNGKGNDDPRDGVDACYCDLLNVQLSFDFLAKSADIVGESGLTGDEAYALFYLMNGLTKELREIMSRLGELVVALRQP